jgi:hypothetical protein
MFVLVSGGCVVLLLLLLLHCVLEQYVNVRGNTAPMLPVHHRVLQTARAATCHVPLLL